MHTIQVETIRIKAEPGIDPLSIYRRSAEQFGDHHAFLAESMSGPAVDCQQSVVAINRIGSVIFRPDSVQIEASPVVRQHLMHTIKSNHDIQSCDATGSLQIDNSAQLWAVLRTVISGCYRHRSNDDDHGFKSGFVARIAYDVGALIENIPHRLPRNESTLIRLDLFQHFVTFQDSAIRLHIAHAPGFGEPHVQALMGVLRPLDALEPSLPPAAKVRFSTSKADYVDACRIALTHIRAGDIYQVQLGHGIDIESAMSPLALYASLRASNPAPYMFLYRCADMDLVGASPESFVRLEGRRLSMRPIAGTLAKTPTIDASVLQRDLCACSKENAEHIMLVDLCRNDIGRLCEPASLAVPSLMALEEFPSLYHLVSTVTGTLREDCDVVDVLRATFPAGTMTGAPKIRAMEIIEQLEQSSRGQYAGALGLIGFDGSMNMALCIRMASRRARSYTIRASAGVVFDSGPEREWQETLAKMRLLFRSLTGMEIDR